ncbi:MAG: hypothetical protein KDD82_23010 [Planctomycetes bacterium]|nr:hypothetical protein [Planctomycetota bacterium]
MPGKTRLFDDLKAGLKALGEELREETKLGRRDARAFWKETLGPKLTAFEGELAKSLNQVGSQAQVQGRKGYAQLKETWSKLEPQLVELGNRAGDPERVKRMTEAMRETIRRATAKRATPESDDDDDLGRTRVDC